MLKMGFHNMILGDFHVSALVSSDTTGRITGIIALSAAIVSSENIIPRWK